MSLKPYTEIRDVTGILPEEKQRIYDFLQGAMYCWCKNNKGDWFSVRSFMGGENFDWGGTPLQVLYDKHKRLGKTDKEAVSEAGKNVGWIMKKVVEDDIRTFETKTEYQIRKYRWIP